MSVSVILFTLISYSTGWMVLRHWRSTHTQTALAAFPIGLGIIILSTILLLHTPLPYHAASFVVWHSILLSPLYIYLWYKNPVSTKEAYLPALTLSAILSVQYLFYVFNYSFFTPDSFGFIDAGHWLIESQGDHTSLYGASSTYMKVLHSIAIICGVDYFSGLFPSITLLLIATIGITLYHYIPSPHSYWLIPAAIGLYASIPQTLVQMFYYNMHGLCATYIAISAMYFLKDEINPKPLWLALGLLALTRVETPLYATILALTYISYNPKTFKEGAIGFALLASFTPFTTIIVGNDQTFGTLPLILMGSLPLILVLIIYTAKEKLLKASHYLLPVALYGLLLIAFILNKSHMTISSTRLLQNFSEFGLWGYIWHLAVIITLLTSSYARKHSDKASYLLVALICAIFVTITISYFRIPYRIGWSDSGNRIMFHYLPLLILWVSTASYHWHNNKSN
jgi:hypothetical protein